MDKIKQSDTGISDNEIIGKILNGEKHFFEILIRRYNPRLFRIGRSYVKDESEIEDMIQEAYVKAFENLSKFENRSSFPTWLIRIFINIALARISKNKRFDYSEDTAYLSQTNMNNNKTKTPEEYLVNSELKQNLEKAIDNLPEKYRTVFMMREIEKMSITETSECLELTETNIKVRLNRAKEMLRKDLLKVYNNVEVFQFLGERCDRIVNNVMKRLNI